MVGLYMTTLSTLENSGMLINCLWSLQVKYIRLGTLSHYIITYYFPTGMFVIVSWISFLVPPESVPGRMTILVTVFLCLVNIFNSITNNPKADGLTAIEAFIIVCIIFVFIALLGG